MAKQSDQVKVAKIQKRMATELVIRDVLVALLNNPVLSFAGGSWAILELQERYGQHGGTVADMIAKLVEQGGGIGLVAGISTAQALSPILPDLIKAGGEAAGAVVGSIGKAVPLLAGGV